jgi:uncharacterized protein YndB with AHSA1/START domain
MTQQKRESAKAAVAKLSSSDKPASDAKAKESTGKSYEEWVSVLDRWGARDKKHPETVRYLMDKHELEGWWAQTVTNVYERARGIRQKHQQGEGFTVYASKTVAAGVDDVFDAFVDSRRRKQWLTDGTMRSRSSQPGRTAHFDWDDSTRVTVTFEGKGSSKTTVSVAHERLADPQEAEKAKASWRQRLSDLNAYLGS